MKAIGKAKSMLNGPFRHRKTPFLKSLKSRSLWHEDNTFLLYTDFSDNVLYSFQIVFRCHHPLEP
jgi:hypothetical protein